MIRRFVELSFRKPFAVLLVFLALGGASFYLASSLGLRLSFLELLPDNAREVQDLNLVSKKAGGDGYLVVQAKGPNPEVLQAYAKALAPELEKLPDVRYVEYHYDIGFFRDRALLLLPADKLKSLREDIQARIQFEKKKANPLYVDLADEEPLTFQQIEKKYGSDIPQSEYLGSKDGKELYLFVKPAGLAGDLRFAQNLLDHTAAVAENVQKNFPGVSTDFTGPFRIRIEENQVMTRDLSRSSILSALIAIGLIFFATRKGSALLVVGAPVVLGIAATFAVAEVTIGYLNIVTGFLAAILIGLGIEYGVHLSMRYWEERRLLPAKEAMTEAMKGTFSGALTSGFTNAAAFFVLYFAKFHAFNQFGMIAGAGVLLTLVAAYGMGPAIIAVAEKVRPLKHLPPEQHAEHGARKNYKPVPTTALVGLAVAIIGFAAYSAYFVRKAYQDADQIFETDMRKLKGNSPATDLDDHIMKELGGQITPAILLVNNLQDAQKVTDIVVAEKAKHGDQTAFWKVASLNDLIPTDVTARQAEIAKLGKVFDDLPESAKSGDNAKKVEALQKMTKAQPWTEKDLPLELRRRFQSLDGTGTFVLLFPSTNPYDSKDLKRWSDQIDEVYDASANAGVEVHILDGNRIASKILSLVKGDGPYIMWSAALAVFLMIWVGLRSFKKTVMVAVPLFLGMTCMFGAMHLFGLKLNFINAVVLPNLLAIAVDNSVHLYHRYEEEGPGSLGHVVRHTGFAAIVATISNAAGYGALLIASHKGLQSIGELAVLGVASTFMGTTVFFPAVLALLERWKGRKGSSTGTGGGNVAVLPINEPAPVTATAEQGKQSA
ncbi:MAG: efflux RND transporter permease subunit [Myxococcaceae bacterium]